jgi:hypothetical protein
MATVCNHTCVAASYRYERVAVLTGRNGFPYRGDRWKYSCAYPTAFWTAGSLAETSGTGSTLRDCSARTTLSNELWTSRWPL